MQQHFESLKNDVIRFLRNVKAVINDDNFDPHLFIGKKTRLRRNDI
ncbi:MAG: hypothetical protein IJX78_08070 [Bacilli bacterium]|nr:hypothetical protein [Bacilli bacterium]